jgi:hypothetical protein
MDLTVNLQGNEKFGDIVEKIKNSNNVMLIRDVQESDTVYSLCFHIKKIGDLIEINRITFQEEGSDYHYVCKTSETDDMIPAIFCPITNKLVRDIYLSYDKYSDNFNIHFSGALATIC